MANYDWNAPAFRTRKFKGYIQFSNPASTSDLYRLKERQSLSVTFSYNLTTHYDDAGMKFLDPAGLQHTFSTSIKLTSDMVDDATADWDSSSSVKTSEGSSLSYWIERLQRYEPVLMTFITTSEALSGPTVAPEASQGDEKMIKIKFTGQPPSFAFDLGGDVAPTVGIQGSITDITHIKRTT